MRWICGARVLHCARDTWARPSSRGAPDAAQYMRARQEARIERRRSFVFFHDLLAFLDETDDRVTRFALRFLADQVEHLRESLDMPLGLAAMFIESGPQVFRSGRLCHFGQGGED